MTAMSVQSTAMETLPPYIKRIIIGLSGKRYAGKDHVASLIARRWAKENVYVTSFGDALKRAAAEHYALDAERLCTSRAYKEQHRDKLIAFGKITRAVEPARWVREAMQRIPEGCNVVVFSDVRFHHEVEALKDYRLWDQRVFLVRIEASLEARRQRGFVTDPVVDSDPSETELDATPHLDALLVNDSNTREPDVDALIDSFLWQIEDEAYKTNAGGTDGGTAPC